MASSCRIAIVGGGLAGLAAANGLKSFGIGAEVFETAPALGEIGAAVNVSPQATKALQKDPTPYLAHISSVLGFTEEQIKWGWPETKFPVEIIPDMLDVLETEEVWVASLTNRAPRSRAQLEKFIDRSVVKEAMASR